MRDCWYFKPTNSRAWSHVDFSKALPERGGYLRSCDNRDAETLQVLSKRSSSLLQCFIGSVCWYYNCHNSAHTRLSEAIFFVVQCWLKPSESHGLENLISTKLGAMLGLVASQLSNLTNYLLHLTGVEPLGNHKLYSTLFKGKHGWHRLCQEQQSVFFFVCLHNFAVLELTSSSQAVLFFLLV